VPPLPPSDLLPRARRVVVLALTGLVAVAGAAGCPAPSTGDACGNGVVEAGEACDDGNDSDADDCVRCAPATCGDHVVRRQPADPALREDCDDGAVDTVACDRDCTARVCGDGLANRTAFAGQPLERCDDGNTVDGDGCSADCKSDEACGNGIRDDHLPKNRTTDPDECLNANAIDTRCAEVCDDGNNVSGDGCSANCLSEETCRNGIVDRLGNGGSNPPETCDDGNAVSIDECSNTCGPTGGCGDGLVNPALEQCDDGAMETATCDYVPLGPFPMLPDPNNCTLALCGDRHRNPLAGEQCDPGAVGVDVATCDADCTLPVCGDGRINVPAGERCDDGNAIDTDGCRSDCTLPRCGDGVVEAGEQCDDGNASNNDDCVHCTRSSCGDGATDLQAPGIEECDDGNAGNDDNCTNQCTIAACGDGFVDGAPPGLEACDLGGQNGQPGSACTTGCKRTAGQACMLPSECASTFCPGGVCGP